MITVISFGYGHGDAPADATFIYDVRRYRDPHFNPDPEFRNLTAYDARIRDMVMATPGVRELISCIVANAVAVPDSVIVIGCVGGRHRSACIAIAVADALTASGQPVRLIHRDLDRPVIERQRA